MRLRMTKRVAAWAVAALFTLTICSSLVRVSAQAQDCDDNAVIRCGITASNLIQKYRENQGGNVQAGFAAMNIPNEAAMSGMVSGWVTADNKVYIGDKLVATNALTIGRQNMPGSTPILNGAFYKRPPSVSFNSARLSALVKMEGETFKFAVIEACGNPVTGTDVPNPGAACTGLEVVEQKDRTVKFIARASVTNGAAVQAYNFDFNGDGQVDRKIATNALQQEVSYTYDRAGQFNAKVSVDTTAGPQTGNQCVKAITIAEEKKPDFTIVKDVRIKGQSNWVQDVQAKPGDTLEYRITVKNTGETDLTNVLVRDRLPAGVTFVNDSIHVNNLQQRDQTQEDGFFGNGFNIGNIARGGSLTVTFAVTVNQNTEACGTNRLRNRSIAKPDNLNEKEDDALTSVCKPNEQPQPAPTPSPTPPAPQPTPAYLPETGAGAIAGIFSVTTMLGSALYKLKEFYLTMLQK